MGRHLTLELQRAALRLLKMWEEKRGTSRQIYFQHRVPEYCNMWRAIAEDIGAEFRDLSDDFWEVKRGNRLIRINNHQLEFDNPVTLSLAGRKHLVHQMLHEQGIAVPNFIVFDLGSLKKACEFLCQYPRGCVIKPVDGYGGKGVTTHVQTEKECRKAAVLAAVYSRNILMEPQIAGESYRLLVIDGKVVHAVRRSGLRVVGDGRQTVEELFRPKQRKPNQPNRQDLKADRDCMFCLHAQGLSLDSVPKRGESILMKAVDEVGQGASEVRTIYDEDVTTLLCDSIKQDAELAAKTVRSEFLGVDVITMNPQVSLKESGGVVNEVNTTPALHHHYEMGKERYPKVALAAVDALMRKRFVGDEVR